MFKRVCVYVWVPFPGEPINPPPGTRPPDPDYGQPEGPGILGGPRPENDLPISGYPGGGPIKPPGRPILPPDPDYPIPILPDHPWLPGRWEPIDPGFGKPPIFGFLPTDPGWGIPETPPPVAGQPLPPGSPGGGHWVPVDPDYGLPERPCGGKPRPPLWAWIAEIGPDFGVKPPPAKPSTKPA